MNWKFSGDRPVYQQIMENIRGAVLGGELPPGGRVRGSAWRNSRCLALPLPRRRRSCFM